MFNNVIHDINGPGLAVYGGYNILVAHNTFYRVGQRTDYLMLISPGRRTCDGEWIGECCAPWAAGAAAVLISQPWLDAAGCNLSPVPPPAQTTSHRR